MKKQISLEVPANDECLHCILLDAIGGYLSHRQSLDATRTIHHVTNVLCEFIAAADHRNDRRAMIREICELIPKRTAEARSQGRYPGGEHHPLGHTSPS